MTVRSRPDAFLRTDKFNSQVIMEVRVYIKKDNRHSASSIAEKKITTVYKAFFSFFLPKYTFTENETTSNI